jgi:DNA polymerase delta subunit 1
MKDLPIDFDYYINKQLKQPLIRIFELILPNPEGIFNGAHTMKRYVPKVGAASALGKFVIKKKFCLCCKGVV